MQEKKSLKSILKHNSKRPALLNKKIKDRLPIDKTFRGIIKRIKAQMMDDDTQNEYHAFN